MGRVRVDISGLELRVESLMGDKAMAEKGLASALVLEREIVLATRSLLNRHQRAGTGSDSLMQSWNGLLTSSAAGGRVRFGVASDKPYADIHNKGGVIGPGPKMLAIPLTDHARGRWPRDWNAGGLAFVRLRGNAFLIKTETKSRRARKKSRRKRPKRWTARPGRQTKPLSKAEKPFEAQYLLRDAVKIEPTHYYDVALKNALPEIKELWGGA